MAFKKDQTVTHDIVKQKHEPCKETKTNIKFRALAVFKCFEVSYWTEKLIHMYYYFMYINTHVVCLWWYLQSSICCKYVLYQHLEFISVDFFFHSYQISREIIM